MTEPVTIALSDADLAELRAWAETSERDLESLLQEAVQEYLQRGRAWIADTRKAEASPFHDLARLEAELRARRAHARRA